MVSGQNYSKYEGEAISNVTEYRSIIGALQYATITRPDISYSVNKLSQFMQNPMDIHWKAIKRVLCYLKGTVNYGLRLKTGQHLHITGYADADWTSDPDDRRSTSGYCIYFGQSLISWCSKKQPTISRSNTKVEYRSIANATAEIKWYNPYYLNSS